MYQMGMECRGPVPAPPHEDPSRTQFLLSGAPFSLCCTMWGQSLKGQGMMDLFENLAFREAKGHTGSELGPRGLTSWPLTADPGGHGRVEAGDQGVQEGQRRNGPSSTLDPLPTFCSPGNGTWSCPEHLALLWSLAPSCGCGGWEPFLWALSLPRPLKEGLERFR